MIKFEYPPNYKDIIAVLPEVKNQPTAVFTYAPHIYVPSGKMLPQEIVDHEEVHIAQQEMLGVTVWWEQFLADPQFRFRQELPAYQRDYFSFCKRNHGRKERYDYLYYLARQLSSEMYGNIINMAEALRLIK